MPLFTPETAQIAASKSVLSRKLNPPVRKPKPVTQRDSNGVERDQFTARRLARVRKQLTMLDDMILSETDPSKLDRLASASAKISVVEQNLAGRPGPGQYRPIPKPSSQAKSIPEPL